MKAEGSCHHLPSSSSHLEVGKKEIMKEIKAPLVNKTPNRRTRGGTNFGGGGLVRAHTTDRSRFFPCPLCPVLQLPSAWEIPRERRAEVGLRPLNLTPP